MSNKCRECARCAHTCGASASVQAVRLHEKDNTATVLQSLQALSTVRIGCVWNGAVEEVPLAEDVDFGHKIAVRAIKTAEAVIKYGEIIGTASQEIAPGAHVHVHNVASRRGRGDKASEAKRNGRNSRAKARILHEESVLQEPLIDLTKATFKGYLREDGRAGTRNVVGILSCVACANDVVMRLADRKSAAFTHQQGCSQTKPDVDRITEVLYNLAANPNLGAVLLVSLGCESVPSEALFERIRALGKPCAMLVVQKEGGMKGAVKRGRKLLRALEKKIADCKRTELPISLLQVGLKCGSSDTTQGLSANVVCGSLTEALVAAGATVVMGETTEFMGAEHIAAAHAANTDVARQIVDRVLDMEKRAMSVGVDMRGGQPTRGNIAGGLTTIEEKSLGALAKAGSAVFREVTDYGMPPKVQGLVMMDAPGREPEMLTGLAAAGCNLIVFTTGRGAPQGFPFVPVVKVTGNSRTADVLKDHIDVYAGAVTDGSQTLAQAAGELVRHVRKAAGGRKTKAEKCGYNNSMNIYVTGPVV